MLKQLLNNKINLAKIVKKFFKLDVFEFPKKTRPNFPEQFFSGKFGHFGPKFDYLRLYQRYRQTRF